MTDHDHHDHHDHHAHTSHGTKSWAEINKAHWDKMAPIYNSTHTQKEFGDLINKINAFLLQNIDWIGVPFIDPSSKFEGRASSDRAVRILDYACGPGTVTAALSGYATEYVGLDISENMVKEYNNRFNDHKDPSTDSTIPAETLNAKAYVADLLDPKGTPASFDDPKFFNFDLAAVSGGFHHFENVELATQRLVERLKPGGVLLIFDFLSHAPNDLHNDPALQTIMHHGFDEARVQQLFGGQGLVDVQIKVMPEKVTLKGKAQRQGFLARGKKPE